MGSRMPQFTCPYCHRLYVSLTCFRKHLATHAPSQPVISSSSSTSITIGNAAIVTRSPRGVAESSSSTSSLVSGDAFFKDFTEEDWMQADSYLCLSQPQNLNLLHSIVYEGANLEFLRAREEKVSRLKNRVSALQGDGAEENGWVIVQSDLCVVAKVATYRSRVQGPNTALKIDVHCRRLNERSGLTNDEAEIARCSSL
ncbi:hypothetical protein Aperf_G00000055457 [Anoplocephala perfoliata]